MAEYSVELKGLVKEFKDFKLGPLDLKIPKGTIVGYIGENGAGKSTTIKLLLGLIRPDQGEITILGQRDPKNTALKDRMGVVFDDLFLPEDTNLKDLENFCSGIYSHWEKQAFYYYVERFHLLKDQPIKNYSRGMKMKLSMAVALSHQAELLLLDEATSGLDPVAREEILDLLMDFMQDEDHTILISSHILSDLDKIADYIAFIHQGKLLFMETKDVLKEEYRICSLSKEDAEKLDPKAIIGRKVHAFGQELLVRKNLVPKNLKLEKPSIEDIMVYFVKGEEK